MDPIRWLSLAALAALPAGPLHAAGDDALVARGGYLALVMDCAGCHMPRDATGAPLSDMGLAGGTVGFELPGLGIFWPSNLTPDPTGLGDWSAAEIETALRTGIRPDGRELAPVMPWRSYAAMGPEDMAALIAWLQAQPAVSNVVPTPVADRASARAPYFEVAVPH